MKEPKPIDVSNIRIIEKKDGPKRIELIPIPPEKERTIMELVGDKFPYLLLRYGRTGIDKILDWDVLPAPIPFLLKGLRWGIDFAARRFYVEQK